MRQQINLYQPTFTLERKRFSAPTVAIACAIVVAGLAAFSVNAQRELERLEHEVDALRVEQEQKDADIAALQAQQGVSTDPTQLELRVRRLAHAIAERTRALEMLQSGAAGQTTGFAARLEALARRHVDGLWIDAIVLSGTDGAMTLSGATLDADNVPLYLQSLARDTVLKGTRFDDFIIERPQPQSKDGAPDNELVKPLKSTGKHIRFRAGAKSLTPAGSEATT